MEPARTFLDLIVWQKAHQHVLQVYAYTSKFPKEEIFGLVSQYRRASISIAANIAEGFKKRGMKDKAKFMNIAQASIEECRYYQILSRDLDYGIFPAAALLDEIGRLLSAYHNSILRSQRTKLFSGVLLGCSFCILYPVYCILYTVSYILTPLTQTL